MYDTRARRDRAGPCHVRVRNPSRAHCTIRWMMLPSCSVFFVDFPFLFAAACKIAVQMGKKERPYAALGRGAVAFDLSSKDFLIETLLRSRQYSASNLRVRTHEGINCEVNSVPVCSDVAIKSRFPVPRCCTVP